MDNGILHWIRLVIAHLCASLAATGFRFESTAHAISSVKHTDPSPQSFRRSRNICGDQMKMWVAITLFQIGCKVYASHNSLPGPVSEQKWAGWRLRGRELYQDQFRPLVDPRCHPRRVGEGSVVRYKVLCGRKGS
jgi:hypothetical protein